MSGILSEENADKEIIKSLLREIRRLNERNKMGKILFDINGDVYRATAFEQLSEAELNEEITRNKEEIEELEKSLGFSNKLQAGEVTPPPVQPEAPVSEPAPEPTPEPQPEVQTPEVEQTPETPVAQDPAVAPAPVDPATAPAPSAPTPIVIS